AAECHALADGIDAGPELICNGLADDRHSQCIFTIGVYEVAPPHEGRAHRPKIRRADGGEREDRMCGPLWLSFGNEPPVPASGSPCERADVHRHGQAHAWQRLATADEPIEHRSDRRWGCELVRRPRQLDDGQMSGSKPGWRVD